TQVDEGLSGASWGAVEAVGDRRDHGAEDAGCEPLLADAVGNSFCRRAGACTDRTWFLEVSGPGHRSLVAGSDVWRRGYSLATRHSLAASSREKLTPFRSSRSEERRVGDGGGD